MGVIVSNEKDEIYRRQAEGVRTPSQNVALKVGSQARMTTASATSKPKVSNGIGLAKLSAAKRGVRPLRLATSGAPLVDDHILPPHREHP
jgi:hypothetical protein